MLTVFVAVEARPGSVVQFESDVEVRGYYQRFGVTAKNADELRKILQDFLATDLQSELVEISELWAPDFGGEDSDLRDEVGDMREIGIWYRSGRAWFGPD